jgi:WD40 repeat protein
MSRGHLPRVDLWAWNGTDLRLEGNLTMKGSNSAWFAWSPDGRRIVTGAYWYGVPPDPAHIQEPMRVWDAATRTVVATLAWDRGGVPDGEGGLYDARLMAWSPTDDVLFFAYSFRGGRTGLAVWDFRAGGVAWSRDGPNALFALSPDGARLATTSRVTSPGALAVRNASTGEVVARRTTNDVGLNGSFTFGVAWSSDGRVLYVANRPAKGVLLTYPGLEVLAALTPTLNRENFAAEHATFSPDDRYLALGFASDWVYVFDLTPAPPVLLVGGVLAVTGGGAAAVGYGWGRRHRRNTSPEEGEP